MIGDINQIIRAYLVTCGTLTDVVGTRIYYPRLPEYTELPALGFFTRGGRGVDGRGLVGVAVGPQRPLMLPPLVPRQNWAHSTCWRWRPGGRGDLGAGGVGLFGMGVFSTIRPASD